MQLRKQLILVLCSAAVLPRANAQTTTATLLGLVRDSSGATVPAAVVTARNALTSFMRTGMTDETGAYLIPNLPVGSYSLIIEKEGFRRFIQEGITLEVNQNARVDAVLSVGEVAESVTVTAEATGVDTRSSSMGELVDRTRIQELPLNGRNAMALARVVPGVISVSAPTSFTSGRSGPDVTVAGGRDTQNEFRFDGTSHQNLTHNSALNFPSPDALQEFKILTSNFSAEHGRNGGGVFLAVTRAGTNDFHGSAWEFLRNKALNARNFFSVDKPDLKQNQFGFTLGGPVLRNRAFFFGSYQGLRMRQTSLFATARPATEPERMGDFTSSPTRPRDPNTGQPFPDGRIPSSRFDEVALQLMERYVPLPNASGDRWVALVPSPTNGDQYLWRVDYNFGASNTVNLRFFRDKTNQLVQNGNISPYSPERDQLQVDNWALHDTHTFSPRLLNELHLGVNRVDTRERSLDTTQLSDLGANLPGVTPPFLSRITVDGFFTLDSGNHFIEHGNIYQVNNSMSWFHGRHSFKFGAEFQRTEMINRASSANNGYFRFDGSITGNAFADFLIGKPRSLDQASPYDRVVKGWNWFAFVQDDLRLTPRVTMNVGLRYQLFRPYHHVHDWTNTYRAGQQSTVVPSAPLGTVFPGDAGISRGLTPVDKNNFAPRVGFAWDALGNGKLSVRTAYGLFYEDFRSDIWTYPAVNQPFVIREFIDNPFSLTDPYRGRVNPFPYIYTPNSAKFSFPMGLYTVPAPVLTSPYVHQMSVSIERALPAGVIAKIGYVGKLAHNLLRMEQKNPAVYIPGRSTTANTDSRRILMPGVYTSFREVTTSSNAAYHSMQLSVNRRFSGGLTWMLSYTLGKLLDYYSAQNIGQTSQDPFNYRADRSRSDEDRRHVLAVSFVYDIPFGREQRGIVSKAFGGWSVAGVVSVLSGLPVWVRSDRDNSLTGVGFDRPDLVGNPEREHGSRNDMIAQFFNTAAFVPNQPGRYGNAARNLFSGPAHSSTDLSLVKNFAISERAGKVQFRTEFFNAWNQVNFGSPEPRLANRNFGQILSAGSPRIVQFAVKYIF
jgi:hypothetical protein